MPLFTYQFWIKQYFLVTECCCFRSLKLPLHSLINLIRKCLCSRSHEALFSYESFLKSYLHFIPVQGARVWSRQPQPIWVSSNDVQTPRKWSLGHLSYVAESLDTHCHPLASLPTPAPVEQQPRQESDWSPKAGLLIGTRQLAADQSQAAPST